jgi:hypothetical protein
VHVSFTKELHTHEWWSIWWHRWAKLWTEEYSVTTQTEKSYHYQWCYYRGILIILCSHLINMELGQLSWYSERLQAECLGSNPSRGKIFFSTVPRPALGLTQPPTQWVLEALSMGVKWPEHEADHSPSTSAEVKKTWIYRSTSPCLHGIVLN